ncbi:hypothetical protein [Schlesneria sp. T3-172]|uniref:hypothetical protein n=1 Tax=Schlesneria sphaerica TaxID=3373610 RepID=UPI0037C86080
MTSTKKAIKKSQVSKRAMIQRINRKLSGDDRKLKASRSQGDLDNLGEHYILDLNRNVVVDTHVDIADTAKKLGCITQWEELVEE